MRIFYGHRPIMDIRIFCSSDSVAVLTPLDCFGHCCPERTASQMENHCPAAVFPNLAKSPEKAEVAETHRNGSADFISYIISLLACRWTFSDFPAFPAGLDYKRWLCSDFISSNSSWFALDFYSQCSTSAASVQRPRTAADQPSESIFFSALSFKAA